MAEEETEELYDPKEEAAAEYLSEVSYGGRHFVEKIFLSQYIDFCPSDVV